MTVTKKWLSQSSQRYLLNYLLYGKSKCLSSRQLPQVELSAKTVRHFSLELLVRALLTAQENIARFAIERNKHIGEQ